MAGLGPYSGVLPQPTVKLLDFLDIKDPWMRYLADLECFLLSGVDASGTVSAEFAAVFGASDSLGVSEFPRGGAEEIAKALRRGLEKYGGEVRLKTHVDEIIVENGTAVGVKLANGKGEVRAPIVLSNASVWDTYGTLLPKGAATATATREAMATPYSESFMHLHLGIDGEGLDFTHTGGHHVVVLDKSKPISQPGNVCMISIASVWEPTMAPAGCHCVHAYTMEPFDGWEELKAADEDAYAARKKEASDKLYVALERVIPDIRDRVLLELIASPATHKSWLRRHRGTYGAAIRAPAMFPGPAVGGVKNLYRVGDSVAPGVGVPAAAGSGVICANTLVSLDAHVACQDRMDVLNVRSRVAAAKK
jgi:phytoene dehydrogenase-like protein